MLAIGNGELDGHPDVGESADCPACKQPHKVEYGTSRSMNPDGTWSEPKESRELGFVKCPTNGKSYMVSLNGKLLFATKPKTDGEYKGCCD